MKECELRARRARRNRSMRRQFQLFVRRGCQDGLDAPQLREHRSLLSVERIGETRVSCPGVPGTKISQRAVNDLLNASAPPNYSSDYRIRGASVNKKHLEQRPLSEVLGTGIPAEER